MMQWRNEYVKLATIIELSKLPSYRPQEIEDLLYCQLWIHIQHHFVSYQVLWKILLDIDD